VSDEDIDHGVDDESPAPSPAFRLPKNGGPESISLSNLSMSDRSVDGSYALDDFDHVEEVQK